MTSPQALGGWFCAVNQAYFMGLFLLISAYFVPGSYDRKGAGRLPEGPPDPPGHPAGRLRLDHPARC